MIAEKSIRRGAFVTLEGGDGAGKSTQIHYMKQWLEGRRIDVLQTREPGGTPLGDQLRGLLLHQPDLSICDLSELLLVFAARRQHLQDLILPALHRGTWVLSDRFTDATYAYQGAGRGIDPAHIQILEHWVQEGWVPDLTILLDVPVDVGIFRSGERTPSPDRFEGQALEFKQKVRDCYLQRAEADPKRFRVVDAAKGEEEVWEKIASLLGEFFGSWKH